MKRYSNVLEVVDCKKWKIWCFRGFLGSVNDSKMLCKVNLCGYAQFQILFDVSKGANALLQIMVYFINKINQKGSHYDICQCDQSVILDKSILTCPSWLMVKSTCDFFIDDFFYRWFFKSDNFFLLLVLLLFIWTTQLGQLSFWLY
jgi:hypothetical protein